MDRLETNICGVTLSNPIIAASGTFGYGLEYKRHTNVDEIGAIVIKGISLNERNGNPMPRLVETYSGILNGIGYPNVGVNSFIKTKMAALKSFKSKIILNILGDTPEEYTAVTEILADQERVDMIEVNISNINPENNQPFYKDLDLTKKIIESTKKAAKNKPVIIKLSPDVADIIPYVKACEDFGADAISAINFIPGISVNIDKMKPALGSIYGGLSGPAIKPIALRFVKEIYESTKLPVIGGGGISCWRDVAEFILTGATAVQIGSANFMDNNVCVEAIHDFNKYLEEKEVEHYSNIIGIAFK